MAIIGTATGIATALGDDIHEAAEAIRRQDMAAETRVAGEELPAR